MLSHNLLLTGDDGAAGYNLTNSLRFRSSASAYLNRTPATATNRKTWTWSGWVKRGTLGSQDDLFAAYVGSGTTDNQYFNLFFDSSNTLRVSGYSTSYLTTTQVFRDPSAWYHIMCVVDTTSATANNRIRLYVNGSEITAFSTRNNPTLNEDLGINQAVQHQIGQNLFGSYFDGYLDEVNFIDGQALTPTSFGSFNALTGVWQPARYTGTYGTNGFYLPFTDNSALTTSSNVGLGRDYSGNGNYWTTNNISITAGATYDSMTDVPTLTSATTANYCVMNPLFMSGTATPTNGNLTVSQANNQSQVAGTFGMSSGKWYYEHTVTAAGGEMSVGIGSAPATGIVGVTSTQYGYYNNNGQKYNSNTGASYGATFTTGDVIGVAYDADAGSLTFYKNNTTQGTAFTGITGTMFPLAATRTSGGQNTSDLNFGQRPFAYTPPTGFNRLNTFNLPNSTIVAGNKQFDATIYTGNGTTQNIVNAGGFQPDFVWVKCRSAAKGHILNDVIRGAGKILSSDSTAAESGNTGDLIGSFNSNGFQVNMNYLGGSNDSSNQNGGTFVGWQWKAGGTAVTNTAGTQSAQVSANTTAGFSIATFTTASSGNFTVGHGLGVAPSMYIIKRRGNTSSWGIWHKNLASGTSYLLFDTSAQVSDPTVFSASPTSTVLNLGSAWTATGAVTSVAYCFSEVAGFSSIGSYIGNGNANGTFVYTGFRPKYIMVKGISNNSRNWWLVDSARLPVNGQVAILFPELSNAEFTTAGSELDILSNGFKLRHSTVNINGSAETYIYMAFAENPFKNSLAR